MFNCMIILENIVCGTVELYRYTHRCFYCFVHPIYISEGRLSIRNTSVYNVMLMIINMIIQLNQDLSKTEHCDHEGGIIIQDCCNRLQ